MKSESNISIKNTTKRKLPSLRFEDIKNAILGKEYELSIVFVGKKRIQTINKQYRKKDKPTDILSFPLTKESGEVIICHEIANKKSKDFQRTEKNFLEFLFIHGMVHLTGLDHGNKMEKLEQKYRKRFSL